MLDHLIEKLDLNSHAHLLGAVPDSQLSDVYQAEDFFVLPTTALERFGMVTLKALASGLPIIGTPVGATPEIVGNLDASLITRDPGPEAIAERIIALVSDGSRLRYLQQNARL